VTDGIRSYLTGYTALYGVRPLTGTAAQASNQRV
jgi:hypothetical protein